MPRRRAAPRDSDRRMQLDHQLCFALYSSSLAMTKLYKGALSALGLTYPQYLVLLALWEHDTQSVSELGERLCLDSGTLTPLLKRMQAAGLLARDRSDADERRVVIRLTEAGHALRTRGRTVPQQVSQATGLDAADLLTLTQQLQSLRMRLQTAADKFPHAAPARAAALSTPAP